MGRPSSYTPEIAAEICERLAGGESLISICSADPMPPKSVVFQWLAKNADFADQYARARITWADSEFERMMEIADTPQEGVIVKVNADGKEEITREDMLGHRKLQVDTRKWALARMFPKKYGDSTLLKHADPDGNKLVVEVTRVKGREE